MCLFMKERVKESLSCTIARIRGIMTKESGYDDDDNMINENQLNKLSKKSIISMKS